MTGRLPQLPGAGPPGDDGPLSPKIQQLEFMFKPRDARKIQGLDAVFTLDDLRRSGALGPRGAVKSSLAYPGLTPNFLHEPLAGVNSDDDLDDDDDDYGDGAGSEGSSGAAARARRRARGLPRSPSPEQPGGRIDPQRYNATAAARAAMLYEKPSVVERMEKGVAACAVMRENRHFRLFSLGVFQPTVNEVRTRSMHRVELHKHLSATTLRAPQADKEVRSAVQHDTVGARLERMYNRVLKQVADESAPASPNPYSTGGSGSGAGGGGGGGAGNRLSGPGAASVAVGRRGQQAQAQAGQGQGQMMSGSSGRGGGGARVVLGALDGGSGSGGQQQQQQQQQQQPGGEGTSSSSRGRSPLLMRSSSIKGGSPANTNSGSPTNGGSSGNGVGGTGRLLVTIPSGGRYPAGAGGGGGPPSPGSPSAGTRERDGPVGQASQRTARSSDYWLRVTLPPEVIEAQLSHLAATTEANLRAYHERVAAAQDALLQSNGLGADALSMAPEAVEQSLKVKLGQIQEDTSVTSYNYSALSREAVLSSQLGAASKQLLTASSLPTFIRAALDHVAEHAGELETLKVPRRQEDGRFKSIRRRARAKSAAGPQPDPNAAGLDMEISLSAGGAGGGGGTARTVSDGASESASGTQDGSRTSDASGSGVWPSYMNVRQRAVSAGPQQQQQLAGAASLLLAPTALHAVPPPARLSDEQHSFHLDHLRRTASPDSTLGGGLGPAGASGEPRWSPPPPVMAPGSRGIPLASAVAVLGGGGGMPLPPRRMGTFIDHKWMEDFRVQLREVEESFPESAPEGLAPLPPLPPGDMDAGAYVRSRLERLWGLLDMPPDMRLDLVLFFTGRDRALLFARHLELWEQATGAVLGREAQVEALVAVQRDIEAGRADLLSREQVSGLCLRVLRLTRWVEALSERLQAECGWTLSYHGKPYPGAEAITSAHLLAFLEQLRQATQGSGLKP